ncbi:Uncharacterised protein [Mycobacterium tuberculosis]|nr:Uncharacterised protein [Mycobacterium tuberculosis]CNM90812.1 Uncharacterised protein [Mycobacterium tuberculosis]CNM92658.1 Uncharacterised protein [Mycobacterium tuberculosis]
MPGPTLPKPDALPSPLLKKPEDGVVVEFPKPGALVMLIGMLIGPKPPLAVKFRGDPGMVKPGIVTGLVPPLNGTFNPNGLIAKPGIVTALVPPLNGTFNPNGLMNRPGESGDSLI